jgi:hypothetical protein
MTPRRCTTSLALALTTVWAMAVPAQGGDVPDYLQWAGWGALLDRLGPEAMPDGSNVVLSQVEAPDSSGYFLPDQNDSEFPDILHINQSGGSTIPSAHATFVGRKYYGITQGPARGVSYVMCYNANGWIGDDFLNINSTAEPEVLPIVKVWNNSWVGSTNNTAVDTRITRKLDFAIVRDDDIVCVGLNNGTQQMPLLAASFNVIAVGRRDGVHSGGFWSGGDSDGRVRPDMIGPLYTVSEAIPLVAGCAAMLVQTAVDGGMDDEAQFAETIKAALMAGAYHYTTGGEAWSNNPSTSGANRGLSTQALDLNSGTGHLNIDRSHRILTGGRTIDGGTGTHTAWAHVDLAEGGTSTFRFTVSQGAAEFNAVAVWNRDVATTNNFGVWSVADVDLELLAVVDGTAMSMLGDDADEWTQGNVASRSVVGNVEHLHISGLAPGVYELEVHNLDAGSLDTSTEIALAWWSDADEEPGVPGDINGDGVVNVNDLLELLQAWGPNPGSPADLDGSGTVDVDDLLLFLTWWNV